MSDLDIFSRLPEFIFRPWLERERAATVEVLAKATDMTIIYRAQGKIAEIDRQLELLSKAHK